MKARKWSCLHFDEIIIRPKRAMALDVDAITMARRLCENLSPDETCTLARMFDLSIDNASYRLGDIAEVMQFLAEEAGFTHPRVYDDDGVLVEKNREVKAIRQRRRSRRRK